MPIALENYKVRIMRMIRILRLIQELRTIVTSIMGSLKSLLWTVPSGLSFPWRVSQQYTRIASAFAILSFTCCHFQSCYSYRGTICVYWSLHVVFGGTGSRHRSCLTLVLSREEPLCYLKGTNKKHDPAARIQLHAGWKFMVYPGVRATTPTGPGLRKDAT